MADESEPNDAARVARRRVLMLGAVGYQGYVSVEMAATDLETIRRTLAYIAEVFA